MLNFNKYFYKYLLVLLLCSLIFIACQTKDEKSDKNNKVDTNKTLTDSTKKFAPHSFINSNMSLQNIIDSQKLNTRRLYLKVNKSEYFMSISYDSRIIKEYPVVFGSDPINDKLQEGDGCTPEGVFHIISKRYDNGWTRKILLNYPTAESWKKHNQAIKERRIAESNIGSEIEIHGHNGTDESMIDRHVNWTAGCISMKNIDIVELYEYVFTGMKVVINK